MEVRKLQVCESTMTFLSLFKTENAFSYDFNSTKHNLTFIHLSFEYKQIFSCHDKHSETTILILVQLQKDQFTPILYWCFIYIYIYILKKIIYFGFSNKKKNKTIATLVFVFLILILIF